MSKGTGLPERDEQWAQHRHGQPRGRGKPANTATRIARLRAMTGLKQKEIGRMTGLAQSKISGIESGTIPTGNITLETAAKLALAFGVHAEDLLDQATLGLIAERMLEGAPHGYWKHDNTGE